MWSRSSGPHRVERQADRHLPPDRLVDGGVEMGGVMPRQYLREARLGAIDDGLAPALVPFLGVGAIAHQGVDIFPLHPLDRLLRSQEMPGAREADLPDGLERKGLRAHLDAADRALDGAD